jgi:hypothetical protein
MEKYLIRQEYFGASILDTEKLQYGFLEQRETDMLKLLQYQGLDNALSSMVRSVDPSIANMVQRNMLSFIDSQKTLGVINADNTLNYTIKPIDIYDLIDLPQESLKAPLKICLDLNKNNSTFLHQKSNINANIKSNKDLSDADLYKIIEESLKDDILELAINTAKVPTTLESFDIKTLSNYAQNANLVLTISYDLPATPLKVMPFNQSLRSNKIAFDLDLENCVKELHINSTGEASYYCPKTNSLIGLGNIRLYNYSIKDLWDVYRNSASLCNSSTAAHQGLWFD